MIEQFLQRQMLCSADLAVSAVPEFVSIGQALEHWLAEQLPPSDPAAPWDLVEQTLAAWARQAQGER